MRRLLVFAALALVLAAPAAASERHPTLAELEHEVMCPTCHQLLELSDAPVADRIRAFIAERIAAGDTKSEIERQLVDQFGEGVLAAPPKRGFGLLAWLLPLLGLVGTGAVVGAIARQWVRHGREPEEEPELDEAAERLLDRELALYD